MEFFPIPPLHDIGDQSRVKQMFADLKSRFLDYKKIQHLDFGTSVNPLQNTNSLLLLMAGSDIMGLLRAFKCSEVTIMSADKLLAAIEDEFLPKVITIYERFKFFTRRQRDDEDPKSFVAILQILAEACGFSDEDKSIWDQFFRGINDPQLRRRLKTFEKMDWQQVKKSFSHAEMDSSSKRNPAADIRNPEKSLVLNALLGNHLNMPSGVKDGGESGGQLGVAKNRQDGVDTLSDSDVCAAAISDGESELVEDTLDDCEECENSFHYPDCPFFSERTSHDFSCKQPGIVSRFHQSPPLEIVDSRPTDSGLKVFEPEGVLCGSKEDDDQIIEMYDKTIEEMYGHSDILDLEGTTESDEQILNMTELVALQSSFRKDRDRHDVSKEVLHNEVRTSSSAEIQDFDVEPNQEQENSQTESHHEKCRLPQKTVKQKKVEKKALKYQCLFCERSFSSFNNRHWHMKAAHSRLKCDDCDKFFASVMFLKQHQADHHGKGQHGVCDQCRVPLEDGETIDEHEKQYHKPPYHTCKYCSKTFDRPLYLKQHVVRTHTGERILHTEVRTSSNAETQDCDTEPSQEQENSHTESRHDLGTFPQRTVKQKQIHLNKKVQQFQCLFCELSFSSGKDEQKHVKAAHPSQSVWAHFKCDECSKLFSSVTSLQQHQADDHGKGKHGVCEQCRVPLEDGETIDEHEKQYHNPPHHTCKYCGRTFLGPHYLKQHVVKTHISEMHYLCEHCPAQFKSLQGLQLHVQAFHIDKQPYKCKICCKEFQHRNTFKSHMIYNHSNGFPFVCEICGSKYPTNSKLNVHQRSHKKDKPFKCNICGKGFAIGWQMETHKFKHLPGKVFTCHVCNKKLSRPSSLKYHMRTLHGIRNIKIIIPKTESGYQHNQATYELV